MDDERFEDLRCKIDPQSGANTDIVIVDIVAIVVDRPVIVDIGGIVLIIAGRPQPPPAGKAHSIESPDYAPSGDNRLLSLFIQAPSRLRQSDTCLAICSYCFGRMHCCSIDKSAIYPSSFKSVIAAR